jgi:hypothetical protein
LISQAEEAEKIEERGRLSVKKVERLIAADRPGRFALIVAARWSFFNGERLTGRATAGNVGGISIARSEDASYRHTERFSGNELKNPRSANLLMPLKRIPSPAPWPS